MGPRHWKPKSRATRPSWRCHWADPVAGSGSGNTVGDAWTARLRTGRWGTEPATCVLRSVMVLRISRTKSLKSFVPGGCGCSWAAVVVLCRCSLSLPALHRGRRGQRQKCPRLSQLAPFSQAGSMVWGVPMLVRGWRPEHLPWTSLLAPRPARSAPSVTCGHSHTSGIPQVRPSQRARLPGS